VCVVCHLESLALWALCIVRNCKYLENTTFQKLDLFPSGLRMALSKGRNIVGVSVPSPEDGNYSSFRNFVPSSYLEFRTMNKVHKRSDPDCRLLPELPHAV
jgi:hypothetical protein